MRSGEPRREELRIGLPDLVVGPPLPGSIVEVVELIDGLGADSARGGTGSAGRDASHPRAGMDLGRLPTRRNALRECLRLRLPLGGEGQIGAPAEARRLDAFDMSVTNQEHLRQDGLPVRSPRSTSSGLAPA